MEDGQPRVVVGVLGEVEVRLDDRPLPIGHARQRSVLTVLAVDARRVVPVEGLIDRIWGERPPHTARSVLRVYLTHLRRALAPTGITIAREGSGYLLVVDFGSVDLHRFQRLLASAKKQHDPLRALALIEDALALWRGDPLPELDTPWAHAVRERLRHERATAEADRIDSVLRCGRHHELLPELTAQSTADPLDERVAGQFMLALYRSGRQADALRQYERIRIRLAEELGADPAPPLRELHQRILTADPALIPTVTGTMVTAGSPPSVVPRQLPAPPRWFTGRAHELAVLDAAQDHQSTVVISAIGGAGGIGKTWLALTWAHRNLDRFPDGQLFVDLRGFSPNSTPTDPVVAVRGFLDALGVLPDRIPVDPEARAALYRSLVADRRMLIVLDNAATAGQIVPLLPGGTTCAVLITSRHRLAALTVRHGARPLPLGVLTDAESRALLVATLGADRVAADESATAELMTLCGGFPLALSLIAARAQPDRPLAEMVTELRESGLDALDTDDPTASLSAALSWSLSHLTEQQRTVFALLGIAPGPDIGLPAAISLTGLPDRKVRAVLRVLTDASLIDSRPGGRYAMHDLIRSYATTHAHTLAEPVREAALKRVVDFYMHTAHTADHLLHPHRQSIRLDLPVPGVHRHPLPELPIALAWLDSEHPNLMAAQQIAVNKQWHQTVWNLAWVLATFQDRRGQHHDLLIVWSAAVNAATNLPDPTNAILAHRLLGRANVGALRYDEAIGHMRQALELAASRQDDTQRAHTHEMLAWTWDERGDRRRALHHADKALALYRTLDNPVWEAHALDLVGWIAARLGDYVSARDHCQAALVLFRQHHPDGAANSLDSLGYIDHHTGAHQQAIDHYNQALALRRAHGAIRQAANTLDRLGDSHAAVRQYEQARTVWREALESYRKQRREADAEQVRRKLDALALDGEPPSESAT